MSIDFSKHILTTKKYDGITIYEFKKPDTIYYSVTFINTCGIMAVTGDFGNWIFSREFHPDEKLRGISRSYCDEKLRINSDQKSEIFDTDTTLKEIDEFEKSYFYDLNEDDPKYEQVKDWIESLRDKAFDELDYLYVAHREKPNFIEHEDVPFGTIRNPYLTNIYDAFEAMEEFLYKKASDVK